MYGIPHAILPVHIRHTYVRTWRIDNRLCRPGGTKPEPCAQNLTRKYGFRGFVFLLFGQDFLGSCFLDPAFFVVFVLFSPNVWYVVDPSRTVLFSSCIWRKSSQCKPFNQFFFRTLLWSR